MYDFHHMTVPHPPLKAYYADPAERSTWLARLFDRTAVDYDRVERVVGLGSGSWYRRRALERCGLTPGMQVVDVGVGTGLTAREAAGLAGASGHVTGVDPSAGMLRNAALPATVDLLLGTAEAIPLAADTMDFLSMGYALRHVSDLATAFGEFHRVLKPGGRVCLLEITSPRRRWARVLLKIYLHDFVPFMARYVARSRDMPELMRYYWDTIEACAPPATILNMLHGAGFIDVQRVTSLGIFSEYSARKPL